jgi:hypothetical protein
MRLTGTRAVHTNAVKGMRGTRTRTTTRLADDGEQVRAVFGQLHLVDGGQQLLRARRGLGLGLGTTRLADDGEQVRAVFGQLHLVDGGQQLLRARRARRHRALLREMSAAILIPKATWFGI